MKKINTILVSVFFLFLTNKSKGQLTGTKWSASINIPAPVNAIFDFKGDTLYILSANNGFVHETLRYMFDKNVLIIQKISFGF
jgi:hypothetical protein